MCTKSPPQSQVKIHVTLERARPTHPLFKNLIIYPYMLPDICIKYRVYTLCFDRFYGQYTRVSICQWADSRMHLINQANTDAGR